MSDQPVAPSSGLMASTSTPAAWRVPVMICQVVPSDRVAVGEGVDLLRVVAPVLADRRLLLLEQVDCRRELGLIERVRVGDAEVWLCGHQHDRRIGDVDGCVVDRVLAGIRSARIEHVGPVGGRWVDLILAPHQEVGAAAVGDAVVDAVERVVRLVLEIGEDLCVARNEVHVDRLDVAAGDEATRCVARSGDDVVLLRCRVELRERLIGRAEGVDRDLATRVGLE